MLRHVPEQSVCPAGHAHALIVHVRPAGHARPHIPQLVLSDVVSTHVAPHNICPAGQPHIPAAHTRPAAQTVPHAPQFIASVWMSTHSIVPPTVHTRRGAVHVGLHVPALHISPDAHVRPHIPQFAGSVIVFTHAPVHAVCPVGHAQAPATQLSPPVHDVPHPPQLALSVCKSTHIPPHATCGAMQISTSAGASMSASMPTTSIPTLSMSTTSMPCASEPIVSAPTVSPLIPSLCPSPPPSGDASVRAGPPQPKAQTVRAHTKAIRHERNNISEPPAARTPIRAIELLSRSSSESSITPPPRLTCVNPLRAATQSLYPRRPMVLHAAPVMIAALCVVAIGYRYYSAFVAARVLSLRDTCETPAHVLYDGQNFVPTNRWVLFGHHFAAISGSGPLIGPTLAAQFGFAPGFLWILIGVVLGGAVHDFVILTASVRRGGRSLAELAREELGPVPGLVAMVAILTIVVIAIAGLGIVVVGALAESAWGTFTVGASIPIALLMGLWSHVFRKGAIRESTIAGVVLLFAALIVGKWVQDGPWGAHFRFSRETITLMIAAYGFVASVLPVWLLLCPRDYLSSYLKIGTIALLVVGIVLVNPRIEAPMFSQWIHGGGPIVRGPLFPFVFVTIACGAISGFHALVSSGTTPKMIDNERDCRAIGYGAMLMEGVVGLTALIAATSLPLRDYYAINTDPSVAIVANAPTRGPDGRPRAATGHGLLRDASELHAFGLALSRRDRVRLGLGASQPAGALVGRALPLSSALALSNPALAAAGYHVDPAEPAPTSLSNEDFARLGVPVTDLPALSASAHERIAARTGGGVSLAVGMARIFSGLPFVRGARGLVAYWYHFAIMFEALFILTTIDTGTRVGRFLVQEFLGKVSAPLGKTGSVPSSVLATTIVVGGWTAFLLTGSVQTIWPMFGIANQLLAVVALTVGTTIILRERGPRYAWVTFVPWLFVGTTTVTAGVQAALRIYLPMTRLRDPAKVIQGWVDAGFVAVLLVCVVTIVAFALPTWRRLVLAPRKPPSADVAGSTA